MNSIAKMGENKSCTGVFPNLNFYIFYKIYYTKKFYLYLLKI